MEANHFSQPLKTLSYISIHKSPQMKIISNLATFTYGLQTKEGATNITTIQVHQLMEMVKREVGIDSRGPLWGYVAKQLGYEGKTPEEVFPIVGRNSHIEWESRCFIPYEEQSEVSDVEHPWKRKLLERNNAVLTRAVSHPVNVRIGTTQYGTTQRMVLGITISPLQEKQC